MRELKELQKGEFEQRLTTEAERKAIADKLAEEHEDQRLALVQKENEVEALRFKSEKIAVAADEWKEKYEGTLSEKAASPVPLETPNVYSPSLSKDQSQSLARQRIRARAARRREAKTGASQRMLEPVDDPAKMIAMLEAFVEYVNLVKALAEPSKDINEQANSLRRLLATQTLMEVPTSALEPLPEAGSDLPAPDSEEGKSLHETIWERIARKGLQLLDGTRVPLGVEHTNLRSATIDIADAILIGAFVNVRNAFTNITFKGDDPIPVRQMSGLDPSSSINLSARGYDHIEAIILKSAIISNTVLTNLLLSQNALGSSGAKYICEMLRTNKGITKLDLARCNLGVEGAKLIANALNTNCAVEYLNLSSNDIGIDGAPSIRELLSSNTSIKTIDLRNNALGDSGAIQISEGLIRNQSLTSIILAGNEIGDISFIENFKIRNETLKTIDLQDNYINSDGLIVLSKVLKQLSPGSLELLVLKGNRVVANSSNGLYTDAGTTALLQVLESGINGNLRNLKIDLRGNDIRKREREALCRVAKESLLF